MPYLPIMRLPLRKEPGYVKRWKDKPEPEPKYGTAWIKWKQANFPGLPLRVIALEAAMGRAHQLKE